MNEPSLISANVAFSTPTTWALLVSVTLSVAPSRAFTVRVLPSSASIVPRTRVACCAEAEHITSDTIAAASVIRLAACFIFYLPKMSCAPPGKSSVPDRFDAAASHRRGDILAIGDARDLEGAVGQLRRIGDEDALACLEVCLGRGVIFHDDGLRGHHNLLLFRRIVTPLVGYSEHLAVDASDRGLDRAVGHLAVRHQVPRSVKLIDVLACREDVDFDRLQGPISLWHRGDADHDAGLNVVKRRLNDAANRGVGLELEFQVGPFTRFDIKRSPSTFSIVPRT